MIQPRIGYHVIETGPRHGDDLRGAFGIFRGLLIGAALWAVVGVVAVSIGSSGDARDVPNPPVAPVALTPHATITPNTAMTPHTTITSPTTITIDRGGRTYDR
jgi:hypothetical protein